MSENLRNEIARTIWETSRADEGTISATGANHVADAVLAVVGPELDRLRAEVERLRMGAPGSVVRGHVEWLTNRAESAEAERDDLRARLAKVEALADDLLRAAHVLIDQPDTNGEYDTGKALEAVVDDLRAALASVPEPSDSEPRPEAFVELLPPDVGHNLWHFGPERAHVTGDACHCRPRPIPHDPAPDADREAGGE